MILKQTKSKYETKLFKRQVQLRNKNKMTFKQDEQKRIKEKRNIKKIII